MAHSPRPSATRSHNPEPAALDRNGPRGSRMGLVAFAIILTLATIAVPFSGVASTSRAGDAISVPSTETIAGDLNAAGRTVRIEGIVEGDANIAAVEVHIPGRIDRSAAIAAARGDITGAIGGSLRIASGNLEIRGTISGSLIVLAGNVTIPSQARIQGDVLIYGGQVDIRGTVGGNITVNAGNVTLGGQIGGNVDASISQLNLLDTARIGGKLTYTSQQTADVAPNAIVTGGTTHDKPLSITSPLGLFNSLLKVVWALICGAFLVAIAPRAASAIGKAGRRILPAAGLGLAGMILGPIVVVILIVTLIGLPAGMILLGGYLIVLYLSQVVVGIVIGRAILSGRWDDGSRGFYLLAMTLGVVIISALRFIPLPYIGGAVSLLISIWGVGTVLLLLARLRPASVLASQP
ncbi:MAG: polymer-forming cytoskeletal protein [Thermomicrobiales bacterium]